MPQHAVTRRRFVQAAGAGLVVAPAVITGIGAEASPRHSSLFTLGVMSGDPGDSHVTLWTRLAPDPLNGGGMGPYPVVVNWEVATDKAMRHVIRRGAAVAHARIGHAIRVHAAGLPSDQWLYYRFQARGEWSRVGRTRTFPDARRQHHGHGFGRHGKHGGSERMRFALVSCQNYEQGFYPAWRDIAEQDIDFVLHVGDYIYESGKTSSPIDPVRVHNSAEIFSVEDYRNRYALHRLDQQLQDAQALFPVIHTPDDHEVDNNYAGEYAEEGAPFQGADFLVRRRNAYQVVAESMPYSPGIGFSNGHGGTQFFRKFDFGELASFFVLDTRQFRTDQPARDNFGSTDPDSLAVEPVFGEALFDLAIDDPNAEMLGMNQEQWLKRQLKYSHAKWNVLAQQVMMTEWNLIRTARATIEFDPTIPPAQKQQILALIDRVDNFFNVDAWDGYRGPRQRLFQILAQARPSNPVVLSGDIHSAWAANLPQNFANPSDLLAVEFVCTSISSTFLGIDPRQTDFVVRQGLPGKNPHIEFFNGLFRGYCLCEVDDERWRTTYRSVGTLADIANPDPLALVPRANSPVQTDAVVEVEAGFTRPGSGKQLTTTFSQLPTI
jgi:alkaline phosphatase D